MLRVGRNTGSSPPQYISCNAPASKQALEQDRHLLKRKLETVRSEYDIRITELQADIRELSRSLTERESVLKQSEKEKAALITELTEQNDRLTSQLKEVLGLMSDVEVSRNMIGILDSLVWHRGESPKAKLLVDHYSTFPHM
ncbi:unnamed protein product [Timema podura]|uniref:Uncharacterized protein n=1 Tax=Timema podura TaxID=61482 RepID=A0ABN7NVJ8_TIMPD|nr:unnamed protein product [Timema podura]